MPEARSLSQAPEARRRPLRPAPFALLGGAALLVAGCITQQMDEQARYQPFAPSAQFPDGAAMRPLPPGTVARGQLPFRPAQAVMRSGPGENQRLPPQTPGPLLATPGPVSLRMLTTGRAAYGAYCLPCHGVLGDGRGVIPRHGFPSPPSYHSARLRQAPEGHFYAVITRGYGAMYPYANRVSPDERWAIIAYIRALQLSQAAPLSDVPPEARAALEGGLSR